MFSNSLWVKKVNRLGREMKTDKDQPSNLFLNAPRRYVMQAFLPTGSNAVINRENARNIVLKWATKKWGRRLPPNAFLENNFDFDDAGLRIATCISEDGGLWAFRSEHIDSNEPRTWVTEAVVADLGNSDAIGVRNSCNLGRGLEIPATTPSFLRDLIINIGLIDAGVRVSHQIIYIEDRASLDAFLKLLLSNERRLPIILTSTMTNKGDASFDAVKLAKGTIGLAHVYSISTLMGLALKDILGKPLSTFNGAVRTYYPGFNIDSEPSRHHLVLHKRIAEWSDEFGTGSKGFIKFLIHQIHYLSVNSPTKIEELPSYFSIRRKLLDKPDRTKQEELESLRIDLEHARQNAEQWQNYACEIETEAKTYELETRRLSAQNQTLAFEIRELRKIPTDKTIPLPTNYLDIGNWVNKYFSDRLILHNRAERGLKNALFSDVGLVGQSLMMLGTEYWEMCSNTDPEQREKLTNAWKSKCNLLGIEYNPQSISSSRLGEYKSEYTIDYKIGQKYKQVLGPHLKYGVSKDERHCLRIYFIWDDERQLVVIGSLPSHLSTRST